MAKKKNLTDRQKRIRRRRRKSTMSRVVFALEIIILVVLMGGLFVYAKLGNMNYEDLNFENVDVNQSVEENQVMKGYTSIALVGLDSREGELDGDVNSDTMIIASINNDTKKVKLVSIYRDTYLRVGSNSDGENVYNKANSAFCTGGPEKMMTMMNKNLDLNIVDYVTVDFKGVADLKELVNMSITQTLTRSIYTSFTTFITIFVVFVMGVSSIREFALPIMVGIVCGAYSSVCITGALWYVMKTKSGKSTK